MTKISKEEYEILKGLDDRWIARDSSGDHGGNLFAYSEKPAKDYDVGGWILGRGIRYIDNHLFQFIKWEDGEPYNIHELIEEYESEETEVKNKEWLNNEVEGRIKKIKTDEVSFAGSDFFDEGYIHGMRDVQAIANQLDETEPKNITLQDITHRIWELPLDSRKYWLEHLNDEFQEGYVVPLGLRTTDGEEQYLTFNGSYFASRRNRCLQQTFATLEEIPEFYRDLAERVL